MRDAKRPIRRLIVAALAGALTGLTVLPALAQQAAAPTPRPSAEIRAAYGLSGTSGWLAVDLDTGEVLDAGDADRAFAPASVAKLPTAAFALDALGPRYRFETRLLAGGGLGTGRLDGDLILAGGGNPELDTDALGELADGLAASGVRRVTGRLVADGSALPQLSEIEQTQGVASSYNPAVSGLNLNYNRVHLKWDARGGRREMSVEAAATRLSPAVEGVRVAVADRRGGPIFAFTDAGGREEWEMAASAFRGRAARWLPVKRPAAHAAEVFRTLARTRGVEIGEIGVGAAGGGGTVLASHRSRPLGEILRDMLRYSTNLTAEVTGTAATRSVGVAVGDLAGSAAVMNAWAASVAGFGAGDPGFRFVNHSGLTTGSRVSPRRMVDLLQAFARRAPEPEARHPRIPGAIAGYLRVHEVADKDVALDYARLDVVAKTGTMNYIRGLAGYVATPKGRRLAFAIFSNDLAARGEGDQPVHRGWMGKARGLERALIRNWVVMADGG